jgi:peptide deformylase
MSLLPVRKFGDPVLREKTHEVGKIDKAIKELVKTMEETMHEASGVGLAATQIGVLKKVFVYDAGEGTKVIINPRIVSRDGEIEDEEGCISVPGVRVKVKRAEKVKIEGQDLEGNPVELEAEGLLARIFQHEMDHLEGKIILDRCSRGERRKALQQIEEMIVEEEGT